MNLKFNTKEILKYVQLVGGVIKTPVAVPILSTVLFKIEKGKLVLEADNTALRSRVEVPGDYEGEFSRCIPYELLSSILKGFADGPIEFIFSEKEVLLNAGTGGEYKLPTEPAADFPKSKYEEATGKVKMGSLDLVESLKKALLFAGNDNKSWDHTILIWIGEENTKIVGGTAFAILEETIDTEGEERKILISRNTAEYIAKSIIYEEEIEFSYTGNMIYISMDGRLISAVQSTGEYADYKKIQKEGDRLYHVDKDALVPALKRLNNIVDKEQKIVKFVIEGTQLSLSYIDIAKTYNAKETLLVDYTGDRIETGFPANQILNALSCFDGNPVMEFISDLKPCFIKSEKTKCLIAAMRPA